MKKRVSVENLVFGMYVVELDRPWADTPFTFQGFFLTTQAQLEVLREHCRAVYIDPERGLDSGVPGAVRLGPGLPVFSLRGSVSHRAAAKIESEFGIRAKRRRRRGQPSLTQRP